MKIILPNGEKRELDVGISYEERRQVVDEILEEWNDYFTRYRNKKTLVCLDVLTTYLCYEVKKEGEDSG